MENKFNDIEINQENEINNNEEEIDLPFKKQAENLPEGWLWVSYNDGSGHLQSPDGQDYFSYDWTTGEYKITSDKSYDFFMVENYESGGYSIGGFDKFQEYAEKYINDNILNKEAKAKTNERKEIKMNKKNLITGAWENLDYDDNGNCIYKENSDGEWIREEYDKFNNLCFSENNEGKTIGVSIRQRVSENENSIDITEIEKVYEQYSIDTILRGLTSEQKDLFCDYVEITIDYGQHLNDNLLSLYKSLIDERSMQGTHIERDDNSITELNKEENELEEPDITDKY